MIITKEEQIQKLPVSRKKEMHSLACLRELKLILTASGAKIFKFRYENKLTGDRTTKTLGEYRQGVYSIKEARNDAIKLLMLYQETGCISKDVELSYSDLWAQWRKQRAARTDIKHTSDESTLNLVERCVLPLVGNIMLKNFNDSKTTDMLITQFKKLQTPDNPRTETLRKCVRYVRMSLDFAIMKGYLQTNPADIIGKNFKSLMVQKPTKHFRAITDPKILKEFIASVNSYCGDASILNCLKWQVLYALLSQNARNISWEEIDFSKKIWTIPGEKIKMTQDFIIPLTDTAIKILKEQGIKKSGYVFESGISKTRMLSENTLNQAIKRIGFGDQTVSHGFRTTFLTLADENSISQGFSDKILSLCIDHRLRHAVASDKAYNRAKFESEKRRVFEWWHGYLGELGFNK